jgi:sugar lactone lactonase YvrE
MTGLAAVDSAAVARAAWARANAALGTNDLLILYKEVARAANAWPTQPTYLWGRAVAAHLRHDTSAALEALESYAALGLGHDLEHDPRFAAYRLLPRFRDAFAHHEANRAPLVRSHVVAQITDSTLWPEGVDYDTRTGRYYLASVRHRTIAEVAADGRVRRELWPRDRPGIGAVLGVRVDSRRGVLWATLAGIPQMEGFTPRDSTIAAVVRVRIADGAVERRWDLPPAKLGHMLGDLVIGPSGDVFMTDSNDPVLYRLRPGADSLERLTSPFFRSLQGLAPTPNDEVLYLADYSHGMLRVDLTTNEVARVDDVPGSTSLGCDGLAWYDGSIIAVQNGVEPARVMRFTLDSSGRRITRAEVLDRNSAIADEPTIGTVVGDEFVYVANSQWEKYTDAGKRKPEKALTAPVLLAVPLRSTVTR